jgi:fermentation-respiration switch protein FrsA (DUF1100 family)
MADPAPVLPPAPSRRAGRWLLRVLLYGAVAYIAVLVMLMIFENRLVFPLVSAKQHWAPAPSPEIQDIEFVSADGTRLHAWWCPRIGSDDVILLCHGNGGNLSHRGNTLLKLRESFNSSVLIFDYPGYGKSEGSPSEKGCYQAADAAYDWLIKDKQFAPKNVILYGESLGGGVATELASRRDHRALVLIKTFTSLPDVAQSLYPWVPVRWLMSNRFDSLSRINRCNRPVFVTHGDADRLIPYEQGRRLFAAANEPKQFLPMPGVEHNDPLPPEFFLSLRQFLKQHPAE